MNEASMGVSCADFDGDGQVDVFLTHCYQHKNTLYRNPGNLLFEHFSRRSRNAAVSYETLGFGTAPLDYDLDGDEDLFFTNGHVLGNNHSPNQMHPQLLSNDGTGVFSDSSSSAGDYFLGRYLGRGAARLDFDGDGDCCGSGRRSGDAGGQSLGQSRGAGFLLICRRVFHRRLWRFCLRRLPSPPPSAIRSFAERRATSLPVIDRTFLSSASSERPRLFRRNSRTPELKRPVD